MNTTLKAQEKLSRAAVEKFEKIDDINEKKIELRCSEVQRKTEVINIIYNYLIIVLNLF